MLKAGMIIAERYEVLGKMAQAAWPMCIKQRIIS